MIDNVKSESADKRLPYSAINGGKYSPITSSVDQSVNKALPWVAFSWFLSGGAIIGLFLLALLVPHIIQSMVQKGIAEFQASIAQQIADISATANTGRQDARIALDKVEQTQTQLGAKGLIQPSTH